MTDAEQVIEEVQRVELTANVLDLSRPELAPIMSRYVATTATPQKPLFRPSNALIVTRSRGQEIPLQDALEKDGWCVTTCRGPGGAACPIMKGERCSLRESVDAAVVFVDPRGYDRYLGSMPRLRCAADSSSPGVVALEGRLNGPTYDGSTALVGALRGPKGVLRAIAALLGRRRE